MIKVDVLARCSVAAAESLPMRCVRAAADCARIAVGRAVSCRGVQILHHYAVHTPIFHVARSLRKNMTPRLHFEWRVKFCVGVRWRVAT